jgi:hypothetical protein
MKVFRLASSLILLLSLSMLALSCGGTSRHLQSISISQTLSANGLSISFVATGTFSAPPTTVTSLPVDWTVQLMAPPPAEYIYTLTTQPFVFSCTTTGPEYGPVVAFAPPDPNAPISGTSKVVVTAAATPVCQQGG